MEAKIFSTDSILNQTFEVLSTDLNDQGTVISTKLIQVVDHVASKLATQHSGRKCQTSGIDSVRFINPARRGDILVCKAIVNKAWRTSLEIGVKVVAEDFRTLEQKDILSAFFTFIPLDEQLRPCEIACPIPESLEEIQRFNDAEFRRYIRIASQNV
jgi:acyl-CoA hydrolase